VADVQSAAEREEALFSNANTVQEQDRAPGRVRPATVKAGGGFQPASPAAEQGGIVGSSGILAVIEGCSQPQGLCKGCGGAEPVLKWNLSLGGRAELIGAMDRESNEKKLVVLDLDETLIHATLAPLDRAPDFQVGFYSVYERPHAREVITSLAGRFRMAVWTSATRGYARDVVSHLFPPAHCLEFVWCRDRCTPFFDHWASELVYRKNLNKLKRKGYRLESLIMVDDRPDCLAKHYGNLVRVTPFDGDRGDRELPQLLEYLIDLEAVENIRAVEKRGWKDRYSS